MTLSLVALAFASITSARVPPARGETGPSAAARSTANTDPTPDLRDTHVRNRFAYIAPQCYVLNRDETDRVLNPCYTCHQRGKVPNYLDDSDFQLVYEMTELGLKNPWSNLFENRSARIESLGDAEILKSVRTSNYTTKDGDLILAQRLADLPASWDLDGDRNWDGYRPDAYFRFDARGFDRDPDAGYTGWRAFAYYPMPGTYWPTNGSAGDVLIRLPEAFRRNRQGDLDPTLYALNLAILESLIKRVDVAIDPVDETLYQTDLNQDGSLGWANVVHYDWAPLEGRTMSYLGQAGQRQAAGQLHLAAGLFPEGTEFLQSLRYLDVTEEGKVRPAARMKELRYARKKSWYNYSELKGLVSRENAERREYENNTIKEVPGDYERGLFAQGWVYQGFIEAADGSLRPQSQEESLYCMGCHGGLGATTDTTFAFARKLDAGAHQGGWYHWSQKDASGLNEPKVEIQGVGVRYAYSYYLMYTRSGSEFLDNSELRARFFNEDKTPRAEAFARLHTDISQALIPSSGRALALDKAYRTIVEDQDFVQGRDANIDPVAWALPIVPKDLPTGIDQAVNPVAFGGCFATDRPCTPDQPSDHGLGINGVTFTFPTRLVLPTRAIIPFKDTPPEAPASGCCRSTELDEHHHAGEPNAASGKE